MSTNTDIKNWYNTFASKQKKTGINLRHYSIINYLIKFGLQKNSRVLEVGCGIGTLTKLMHDFVSKGEIIATDISNISVEMAKTTLNNSKRATFFVTDMQNFELDKKVDFIVLPDVLEHIPVENHTELFKTLSNLLTENGVLFIHIPHPNVIDYLHKEHPEKLQIIDQSLAADELMQHAYLSDFKLIEYKSYSLFYDKNDYVAITFKKNASYVFQNKSQLKIIYQKMKARLQFNLSKI